MLILWQYAEYMIGKAANDDGKILGWIELERGDLNIDFEYRPRPNMKNEVLR